MKVQITLTIDGGHVDLSEDELLESADVDEVSEATEEDHIEAATTNLESILEEIGFSEIEDALEGEVSDVTIEDITFDDESEIKFIENE